MKSTGQTPNTYTSYDLPVGCPYVIRCLSEYCTARSQDFFKTSRASILQHTSISTINKYTYPSIRRKHSRMHECMHQCIQAFSPSSFFFLSSSSSRIVSPNSCISLSLSLFLYTCIIYVSIIHIETYIYIYHMYTYIQIITVCIDI